MPHAVFALSLAATDSIKADDPTYFKLLIRDIDNPSGQLNDGSLCSSFEFAGVGCNMTLQAGVSTTTAHSITLSEAIAITTGSNKAVGLNLIVADSSPASELTGFSVHIVLKSGSNLIDDYVFNVSTSDPTGFASYSNSRDAAKPTFVSIAWASNLPPPATTTFAPSTTQGSTVSPTSPPSTTTAPKLPIDCNDIEQDDRTDGEKTIYPDGVTPIKLSIAETFSRGPSCVETNFNATFDEYKSALGCSDHGDGNYWMGLNAMHNLTNSGKDYALRIDLCCKKKPVQTLIYHQFKIDDESSNYTLRATADISGIGLDFSSGAKDINAPFATPDRYIRPNSIASCDILEYEDDGNKVQKYGGWWYGSCGNNLNGALLDSNSLGDSCSIKNFSRVKELGIAMKTTTGTNSGGWNLDLVSYDRVRMAVFDFDSLMIDDRDKFCAN
ncbi:unnamed protein product [Caenorhabditis bovis]|uniref:Fibrinogen C-terminal domain-containing protein n=1 Tax=Caenorhabditis bovis TaxID=2654633 RepID=A0A8S1F6Y4_9PELO|nr:unnamed protein product [Caenorhabditis bovis]